MEASHRDLLPTLDFLINNGMPPRHDAARRTTPVREAVHARAEIGK
jgi:hypothetical protein